MISPTTVPRAFIKWMEDNGYGTFGTDIFLNQVPDDSTDNVWYLTTGGGDVSAKNVTAENTKAYVFDVTCRNASGDAVEANLFQLETVINTRGDFAIDGFDIYSIESTMSDDLDRDAENRRQASITVTIEIYKSYVS